MNLQEINRLKATYSTKELEDLLEDLTSADNLIDADYELIGNIQNALLS